MSVSVSTLAERQLFQRLKHAQSGIKNQLGLLTNRLTSRWVFQCFQVMHLLNINGAEQVSNLKIGCRLKG